MQSKKLSKRDVIAMALRQEIIEDAYPEGHALPGEHALCDRFDVSRATLRLALGDLEKDGYIKRQPGSGTFANPSRMVMPRALGLLLLEPHKAGTVGMSALIHGANAYLDSIGSHLVVINRPPDQWNISLIKTLAGVLVVPTTVTEAHLKSLDGLSLPHIAVTDNELPGASIRFDVKSAAQQLTRRLLELGHRRFALLSGHNVHSDRFRKLGIAEVLAQAGIDFASVPDYCTNYETEAGWEAVRRLFKTKPHPTAVIAFDDSLALQVLRAAQESGLHVPRDVSVTGFNDAPHAALVTPSISTVRIPFVEAGRAAAEALCRAYLRHAPMHDLPLPCEWIERESTGPAAS